MEVSNEDGIYVYGRKKSHCPEQMPPEDSTITVGSGKHGVKDVLQDTTTVILASYPMFDTQRHWQGSCLWHERLQRLHYTISSS